MSAALLAFVLGAVAHADDFSRVDVGDVVALEMEWWDRKKRRRETHVRLPAQDVALAEDTAHQAPMVAAAHATARLVEAVYRKRSDVDVDVEVMVDGGMRYAVEAEDSEQAVSVLASAQDLGERIFDAELQSRGYRMLEGDIVAPDYRAAVEAAAPHLGALARSLGPRKDRRAYTNQALAFVQSIPYEEISPGEDAWRPPLAVLSMNRGDCDSMVTLFLAIMRAAYPEMDLAAVIIPGHALAAVDIAPREDDAVVGRGRRRLVVAEAVGPSLARVGWVEGRSRRVLKRRNRQVIRMPGA